MKPMLIFPAVFILCATSCFAADGSTLDGPGLAAGGALQNSPFHRRTIVINRVSHRYAVWLPPAYDPAKSWPLIVFLHGAGERGTDGLQPTTVGIGPALVQFPERFPAVVVFPQCPYASVWGAQLGIVDQEVAQTLRDFNTDRRRIYLTGVSLGGFGTWKYAGLRPDAFAAIMPISGAGSAEDIGKIVDIPAWVFMNAGDPIVPVKLVRWSVLLAKLSSANLRYTEYPLNIHDAWSATYSNEKVITWLFSQTLDSTEAGPSFGTPSDMPSIRKGMRNFK